MEYKWEGGACVPQRVHTIVISVQHSEDITVEDMRKQLKEVVINVNGIEHPLVSSELSTFLLINYDITKTHSCIQLCPVMIR